MELQKIKFKDSKAERVYNNYLKNIRNAVSKLTKEEQLDVLMEFNSHIYESLQLSKKEDEELNTLLDSIDKLGIPEIVLKPLIAQKALEKATKTFNPFHVAKAISLNIANGVYFTIYGLLYLSLSSFIFLIFSKIFNPSNTGIFYKNDKIESFGLISNTKGLEEIAGSWFIPLMIGAVLTLYIVITLTLKLKKSINTKS